MLSKVHEAFTKSHNSKGLVERWSKVQFTPIYVANTKAVAFGSCHKENGAAKPFQAQHRMDWRQHQCRANSLAWAQITKTKHKEVMKVNTFQYGRNLSGACWYHHLHGHGGVGRNAHRSVCNEIIQKDTSFDSKWFPFNAPKYWGANENFKI